MGIKLNLEVEETDELLPQAGEVQVEANDSRVDEYVKLEDHLKAEAEKLKTSAEQRRFNELKDQFKEEAEKKKADEEAVFVGSKYELVFSKKSNATTITSVKLAAELLGDTFWDICSVPVGKLKDYLTKPDVDKVTDVDRTGSRSIKRKPL